METSPALLSMQLEVGSQWFSMSWNKVDNPDIRINGVGINSLLLYGCMHYYYYYYFYYYYYYYYYHHHYYYQLNGYYYTA